MRSLPARRIVFTWIAALAVLLATLAPAVAQALAAASGRGWFEVCSASDGAATQAGPARKDGAPEPAAPHPFEHCPYCALHADLAPPSAPSGWTAAAASAFVERPAAFLDAPKRFWIWSAAQPRAPPASA